ncbi:Asp-tRNA(Asn)/Glu-tRNA(Gln) amidotransferase subunit GatC [Immundisolibacter cernigliae]|uniref:Aspartyl/glutamyl-tRNA(Asn/Gln) amidotransferase subunit C n=1 Tax=Immundisolibacter cernigliae TaxID=1810504 RepID=A0A1B1YUZ7_9GAMM|nr:Asp-tRNA(Asn)/Glu-tRNA(Gln) amidotransferase subunit GatC [Immundisolibacter cernigliae]ANX04556.1 asparaginyl/glutamyl-tRNA amidotransferase subunit C [Immundisolibacter cernigliae]
MSISSDEVRKVAHLARIEVSADQLTTYAAELSTILELVTQLDGADTAQVPPLAHPIDASQRLRADTVAETDQRRRFQAIAPAVQDGLYLVPKVIE